MKGRARVISGGVDRVAVQNNNFEDMFVPKWDDADGLAQAQAHRQPRVDLENKMTPPLGGVMKPARRGA